MSAPTTYDEQLSVLTLFYRKYDSSKAGEGCRAILDKRRGKAPAVAPSDFVELCRALQQKYGESPLQQLGASRGAAAAVPATLDAQLAALDAFYARHDPAKVGASCRAMLDKRRGAEPAMRPVDFRELCTKLQQKYGESPLLSAARAEVAKSATPSGAAAAADLAGTAVEGATPSGAPAPPGAAVEAAAGATSPAAGARTPSGAVAATDGTASPTDGAANVTGEVPATLDAQLAALDAFYARHDPTKVGDSCRALLDKRRGAEPAMRPDDFRELCAKLQQKYGESPLLSAARAEVAKSATPSGAAAAADLPATAVGGATPSGAPASPGAAVEAAAGATSPAAGAGTPSGAVAATDGTASPTDGAANVTGEAPATLAAVSVASPAAGAAQTPSGASASAGAASPDAGGAATPSLAEPRPPRRWGAASPAAASCASPTASGSAEVPSTLESQFAVLDRFYAKHDGAKAGNSCRAILDKRRGADPAMRPGDFAELCAKLQQKYGENPLAPARAAHSNGSAATVSVAAYASAGHGVVPLTYEAQLSVLDSFYAKFDRQKVGSGTKAILDGRRGAAPAMELGAFAALCCKLADKYDASPLEASVPAEAQAQLATLNRFYATHDSSKVGAGCQAMLDKRRGGDPTLGRAGFLELCWRLQQKYGESPLAA